MTMEMSKKMRYIPPIAELTNVDMEGVVASSLSPSQHIELKDWVHEDSSNPQNNADVWIDF
jgi:hypothetical protein